MLTPEAIANAKRISGYDHVGYNPSGNSCPKPYQADVYGGKRDKAGRAWKGPRRATAKEAAQDYCDFVNSATSFTPAPKLRNAGHKGPQRPKLSSDPEVQYALGVLRDARAQRCGEQGYVYLIVEHTGGAKPMFGKVGFSTNPAKRVAELQTGNPRRLRLFAMRPGTLEDEAAVHQKHIDKNILQEWFRITPELLLEWDRTHRVPVAQSDGASQKEATTA